MYKIGGFEYIYLLMIVIYAGMSTADTVGLIGFSGSSIIGFLIPPIMTIILMARNSVSFANKNLFVVIGILTLWFIVQFIVRDGQINASLTAFHYYQLIICYIVIRVFREKLFSVYEDIVYRLSVLGLVLWTLSVVMPNTMASFFRLFNNSTGTTEGSCYFYTMMRIDLIQGSIIRNAGFAWEPGRYACFICMAIFCNFLINGYRIKHNPRLWVFLISLFSTQSTTGIITLMVLMLLFVLNSKKVSSGLLWAGLLVPIAFYMFTLDFVGDKINKNIERTEMVADMPYNNNGGYSLDRMESMAIEWNNFIHDPIWGFGEQRHSFTEKTFGEGFFTNNGFMQIWAKYGVILGWLYYFCVYYSSRKIAIFGGDKAVFSYLLLFCSISMSYNWQQIVLMLSFSFWGLFMPTSSEKNNNVESKMLVQQFN